MDAKTAEKQIIRIIRHAQRRGVPIHGVLFVGDEAIYPGTCRDDIDREAHP